jgi:hypothetical protein
MKNDESYYERYKEYFEYSSRGDYYTYNIELINFNDNKQWPVDNCINCKCDLEQNKPVKKYVRLNSPVAAFLIGIFLIPILWYGISIIAGITAYISKTVAYIILAALPILSLTIPFYFARGSSIILYYCPKCNCLLYNTSPSIVVSTKRHPNIFLPQIEKIAKFRFKSYYDKYQYDKV